MKQFSTKMTQYDWRPRRDDRYEKYPMSVSRWKHTDIIGAPFSRKLVFYGIQRTIKNPQTYNLNEGYQFLLLILTLYLSENVNQILR